MKNKILKIVQHLLVAKRNGNIKLEQKHYDSLLSFCQANNINFTNALEGATKVLKSQPANIMQGVA